MPPERCYFIGGPRENFDTADRARAFLASLESRGVHNGARMKFGEYSVDWGHTAGAELLKGRGRECIGVLAANDEIAYGVLLAAQDAGADVPRDLRLIGFDDTRLASLVRPQISSVRVPMSDVGSEAVRLLVQRINDPDLSAQTVRLATRLIVRQSS